MQILASLSGIILSLLLAPLLPGIINRVKAFMGGRKGRPLLQLYYDLRRLIGKSPVYPSVTTWFFRAAPVSCASVSLMALVLLPFGHSRALLAFPGDFVLLAGLFCLARFSLLLAALDTGSAFEGMGAAREALFSALAEPIFLFCLFILCQQSQQFSLSVLAADADLWEEGDWMPRLMLAFSLFLLLLSENSRIPVDDPNTHLELTMIHEVMILDHSGPDLAFLEYAAALKLWVFSLLIVGVLLPGSLGLSQEYGGYFSLAGMFFNWVLTLAAVFGMGVLTGFVESLMARLRMERIPQFLAMAGAFASLAALTLWGRA
ncbi:MAG: NADH-quinone oxidoreductase subunit H [Desulfovibrio sp.]|jgi:formate hydrogenlyase subunit 4|nr:NADH-quinone oxidoreductase subunit H [Desulfovibrio sp.]